MNHISLKKACRPSVTQGYPLHRIHFGPHPSVVLREEGDGDHYSYVRKAIRWLILLYMHGLVHEVGQSHSV